VSPHFTQFFYDGQIGRRYFGLFAEGMSGHGAPENEELRVTWLVSDGPAFRCARALAERRARAAFPLLYFLTQRQDAQSGSRRAAFMLCKNNHEIGRIGSRCPGTFGSECLHSCCASGC
jgi:hypothetical protein